MSIWHYLQTLSLIHIFLSAQGKTKVTMIISVFSSILNVVLDPLFIFEYEPLFGLRGLGMGIAGAAWATVIAQAVKVLLGLVAIRSRANNVRVRLRGVRLKWRKFFELMRVGFPTALGQSSAAIGFTVLNSVVEMCIRDRSSPMKSSPTMNASARPRGVI